MSNSNDRGDNDSQHDPYAVDEPAAGDVADDAQPYLEAVPSAASPQPVPPTQPMHLYAPGAPKPSGLMCIRCGYNLTGTTIGGNCPECDTPIETSISNVQAGQASGKAIAALVLGIVSLPSCMFYGVPALILGGLSLVFGTMALNDVKRGLAPASAKQQAVAGMICGGIAIGLTIVCIAVLGALFML
jgi:hypothetical protein